MVQYRINVDPNTWQILIQKSREANKTINQIINDLISKYISEDPKCILCYNKCTYIALCENCFNQLKKSHETLKWLTNLIALHLKNSL